MKALAILLLSAASVLAAPPFQNVTWGIWFDYPTNMPVLSYYAPGTNEAFRIYGTSTLGTPQANWPFITTWTNWALITNGPTISISNNVTLPFAPQYFFMFNPTNTWGEPPFSLNYWSWVMSGPVWSTVNNSSLNRQGP